MLVKSDAFGTVAIEKSTFTHGWKDSRFYVHRWSEDGSLYLTTTGQWVFTCEEGWFDTLEEARDALTKAEEAFIATP
jgi:hypothetical protein